MRALILLPLLLLAPSPSLAQHGGTLNLVRYRAGDEVSWGILEGERIREIDGSIFGAHRATDRWTALASVTLLPPTDPSKIIAVGLNYRSHLGEREAAAEPGLFAKLPSSLVGQDADIVMPPGATDVHYEGEMVLVIGRRCARVPREEAMDCVFGITAGNDVSERAWQRDDLQWLRAKASDTFGPVGPTIAVGVNPDDVLVQTRVNGEVRQSQRTSDLIFDVRDIISYISRYVTLEAGDLVFTGTPGATSALQPGDVVEVEVEGVGVLRNRVVRGR